MFDFLLIPWTVAHQAPLSMRFFQARIWEWVAISFSGGSSWLRDWTHVSCIGRSSLKTKQNKTLSYLGSPVTALLRDKYMPWKSPDNHDGVITHLEPDILECEVKWALGSITMNKASQDDGIPVELFQIMEDDAVKVLHSICQQIWETQQWPQDWKRSVFIPIPKKCNAKECSNYHTIALISHASKVMLKIL